MRDKIKAFYTIKKQEWNFFMKRFSEKKYKLYDEDKFLLTAPYVCTGIENKTLGFNTIFDGTKHNSEFLPKQEFILDVIQKRYTEYNYKCGLIHLGTGGGKSHIMMGIYEKFNTNTLILVHNTKMIQEITEKFKNFMDVNILPYYSKVKKVGHVTITTHTTFVRNNGEIPGCDPEILLYDEAHVTLSEKMITALCNTKAQALYGFTGTPYTDKFTTEEMEKIFGKIIKPEDDEYFYTPEFEFLNYEHLGRYDFNLTFADLRTKIFENKERQELQIEKIREVYEERNVILVLTDRVEEANFYEEALSGLNTVKIIGETKDPAKEMKAAEGKGKMIIIGTYHRLGTGFDYPPIDGICLFQPVKIKQSVIQCIGRGLRKYEGKTGCKVYIWNDMMLKSQRLDKITAIEQEYGIEAKINEIDLKNDRINFNIKSKSKIEDINKKINKFNIDNLHLFVNIKGKEFDSEKSATTYMLGDYRNRGYYVHKIADDSRGYKPYDFDLECKEGKYSVEAKSISGYTFNSKILRDNQYSSLKKKLELGHSIPLVLVFSKKTRMYKYIPFELILKEKELSIKLFS